MVETNVLRAYAEDMEEEGWHTVAKGLLKAADEIDRLLERDDWLQCLEACGVDNWQGIDAAIEMHNGDNDG